MKKAFLVLITIIFCTFNTNAQNNLPVELNEEDIANFKLKVKEKVEALQNHIVIIASKEQEMSKRDLAVKTALKLFLSTAVMEVSSTANDKQAKFSRPMKEYFNRLKNLPSRTVKITSQSVCYISGIVKATDNKYKATATIYEMLEGCNAESDCYKVYNKKEIDITIEYKEDDFGQKRWVIMLGDMKITETKKA